jgi:hypothetical protein
MLQEKCMDDAQIRILQEAYLDALLASTQVTDPAAVKPALAAVDYARSALADALEIPQAERYGSAYYGRLLGRDEGAVTGPRQRLPLDLLIGWMVGQPASDSE